MTLDGPVVHCDTCGKGIAEPEDLVVLTTYFFGGIRVYCVPCFGILARQGKYHTESHVVLNNLGVAGLLLLIGFNGGIIGFLLWALRKVTEPQSPFVQEPWSGLAGALVALFMGLLVVSTVKLLLQRWRSWTDFEMPLKRRADRGQQAL